MGYDHIEQRHAVTINEFYRAHFNPYLNFHRPCGFATVTMDRKGKRRRTYKTYQTPYERFRALPNAARHLREGVTFEALDKEAKSLTDNQSAQDMQHAKNKLFAGFGPLPRKVKTKNSHAPREILIPKKEARSRIY
jgi:hypothetical protein